MALTLGLSQKGTFCGPALSLKPLIFFQKVGYFLKEFVLAVPGRTNSFPLAGRLSVNRDSKKGCPANGAPHIDDYLNGMAYMSPPLDHRSLRPRSSLSGVLGPTLRSKTSP